MAKVKATAQKIEQRINVFEKSGVVVNHYDFDNKYPQRVIDITNDSGTAVTCLKIANKFVFGGGLKDTIFYKNKVNATETADKFTRKLINSYLKLNGVAVHFNYNGLFKKRDATIVPFEYCRLVPESDKVNAGKIAIYDDWGVVKHKFEKDKIFYVNRYNPSKVEQEVEECGGWENYNGQLMYPETYPLAMYDSVLEDMLTEAQLKKFKHSSSVNNFMASHMLIVGKSEEDENGNIDTSLEDNLKEFQGGENAGTIIILEKESNEDPIELKKIEIQDYDGLYEYTENSARESIISCFQIPHILLLKNVSTGLSTNDIANAFDYYSSITYNDRLIIEEYLQEIFSNFHYDICPSGDYSLLPLKYQRPIDQPYLSYYTKNEIRLANGDAEAVDTKADTTLLAVTLGVGGTQALTAILADTTLTTDQKKGTLMVLFGLNEEQTNQMLGI